MANPAPIVVTLSEANGGTREFADEDRFSAWLTQEARKFNWLEDVRVTGSGPLEVNWAEEAKTIRGQAARPFNEANAKLINQVGPDSAADVLRSQETRGALVVSGTLRYEFLEQLRQQRPLVAAYALRFLIRGTVIPPPVNAPWNNEAHLGALEAMLFDLGLYNRPVEPAKAAVDQLITNWSGQLRMARLGSDDVIKRCNEWLVGTQKTIEIHEGSLRAAVERCTEVNNELRVRADDAAKDAEDEVRKKTEELGKELQASHAAFQSDLDRFKDAIRNSIALQAPVAYWKSRNDAHDKNAGAWLTKTYLAVGLGLALLVAAFLFSWQAEFYNQNLQEAWIQVLLHIGPTSVAVFLAIWALRFTLRNYLSEKHLANDATLRATMVETYLALAQRTSVPANDPGLLIALEALFRPAQLGLIADEQMPPTPHSLFQRLLEDGK